MASAALTLLGTGSSGGVPRIGNDWGDCDPTEPRNRRLRCSALLEQTADGEEGRVTRVLIDTSPDMREQLLAANVRALDGVDLEIRKGEIFALLGPNGAGKTTTINLICGLLKADSGAIYLKGQPVSHATKPLVGIVPQENLLYRSLTCALNLWFIGQL